MVLETNQVVKKYIEVFSVASERRKQQRHYQISVRFKTTRSRLLARVHSCSRKSATKNAISILGGDIRHTSPPADEAKSKRYRCYNAKYEIHIKL